MLISAFCGAEIMTEKVLACKWWMLVLLAVGKSQVQGIYY